MSATKQRPTDVKYSEAHAVATGLHELIGELLKELPAPGSEKFHWGDVHDMQEINSRLSRVVAFLEGSDE